ncbi:MAG: IclR family transcriptional regulator [Acidobacteriota bacterium]
MRKERENLVPAVGRALQLLQLLAQSRKGLTISEASRRLGIPKSSAHRLLKALEQNGCVQKDGRVGRYRFGLMLVALSRAALESLEMCEEAKPFLIALMQKTGLTVHMAVLEAGQAIIVEKIEAPGIIKIGTWIGRAMDLNSTACGKALIAFLPPDELNRHMKAKSFVRHNQRTIVSVARLKQDLAAVRELGYAVDDEEDEIGVRCVGAPVFDSAGRVISAISVVGTTNQIAPDRVEAVGKIVRQFATVISSQLSQRAGSM